MTTKSLIFFLIIIWGTISCKTKNISSFGKDLKYTSINNLSNESQSFDFYNLPKTECNSSIQNLNLSYSKTCLYKTATNKNNKHFQKHDSRSNAAISYKKKLNKKSPIVDFEIVSEKPINKFTLFLLAVFFPPLAVGIIKGIPSWQFFLAIGLTLSLFYLE